MEETHLNITKKKVIRTAAVPGSLYGLLKGQLRFLNQHYEVIGLASQGPLLQKVKEREGIRTIAVEIDRSINPIKDLVSLYRLYKVFRKEKPYMVHSITPKAGLLSMMAAYLAKVPVRAHTFTGLIFPTKTGIMKRLLLFFDKVICRFATHIYPEGNGVKNDLIEYRVTQKPLNVIANGNVNGKDLEYYDRALFTGDSLVKKKESLGIGENDFVFVFIGRLVNDKGINELVGAFCDLLSQHENVVLLLVGSYKGETDLLPNVTWQKINNEPRIICAGPQDDVRPFFCISNALVFPSYREGFPNVVLEAGAMALPCLVTDINGSNEIIEHQKNGYIIPSKDKKALFDAMKLFMEHPEMLKKMADQARPIIAEKFEQSIVWKALLNEYKRIENEVMPIHVN